MSALADRSNPILDAFKGEIAKLLWQCYEDIKDQEIPLHISVFHIPVNITVKVSNYRGIIEKLVGPEPVPSPVPS